MDCTALPNDSQVSAFLRALFAAGDCIVIRPIETWTEGGKKISRVDYRGITYRRLGMNTEGTWRHEDSLFSVLMKPIRERSATERANVYFGVCSRFGSGSGGKTFDQAWQIRTVRTLWSDIDHVTVDEARERIKAAGLPEPSVVVNSGNGAHVYWLLDSPYMVDDVGDPEPVYTEFTDQGEGRKKKARKYRLEGEEKLYLDVRSNVPALSPKAQLVQDVLAGIATKIGGDHTTDLSRLLRMPGTLNRKDERTGKAPIPCTLVECEPSRRYAFDVFSPLAAASPDKVRREQLAKVKLPAPRKLTPTRQDKFSALLLACDTAEVGHRSEADFSLCCFAIKAGMIKTEVSGQVANVGKFGEGGERYFERTWAAAENQVRGEILTRVAGGTVSGDAGDAASPISSSGNGGEEKKSQATVLVDLTIEAGVELWHTSGGDAYATLPVESHREHVPLRAKAFRRWLSRQYYVMTEGAVGSEALQSAINVLEGKALFDGTEHPVAVRSAEHEGNIYIDLCDPAWRAVECSPTGWRIVKNPPVRFRRAKAMLSLPEPVSGGHVDALRNYLNVHDDEWPLVVAWLLAAYRPRGPYPVLNLHGEQGSAKSTSAKVMRTLLDPNTAPLRCEPKEPRDLMIAATNGWIISLDNLSHIPAWLSDALCRLSTGGGFSTRELFTDQDEVIFDAMRPVVITGIEELATRSDLLDRSLMASLPTIPESRRRPESEFWAAFGKARPAILGAMLTAVCEAMSRITSTTIDKLPRMADFALWAVSGERFLGVQPGGFMAAYTANRTAGNEMALEASPVAKSVITFMETRTSWTGPASDLMDELEEIIGEKVRRSKAWPQSARGLSGMLKRLSPNLRQVGLHVEFTHEGRGRAKRRAIAIRREEEFCVPTVPTVPNPAKQGSSGDAGDANAVDGDAKGTQTTVAVTPCGATVGTHGDDGDAKSPLHSNAVDEVEEWAA